MTAISNFTGEYDFLSNFHTGPGGFCVSGLGYGGTFVTSSEVAYQAFKAADPAVQAKIINAATPGEAKRLGRQVRPLPEWWEHRRKAIMLDVLLAKFSAPWYHDRLLATGDAVLIEGNHWGDDYWGAVPYDGPSDHWATMLPIWQAPVPGQVLAGHNWLGRLLMMVRDVMAP